VPQGAFFSEKMMKAILGSKQEMNQAFVAGTRVPVTVVKAGPCVVTQVKSEEKDGYWAVQIGFGEKKDTKLTKPMKGHLKGAIKDKKAPRFLAEVSFDKEPDLKVGDVVKVSDVFKKGDIIQVTGISKGKGFAGVMKRWGFKGGPRTHGQSDRQRAPGSIGQGTDPGRVWKGKKMAGRMGRDTKTIKNLMVISIDEEKGEIEISGPVPGAKGSTLFIKKIRSGKLSELEVEKPDVKMQQEVPEEEEKKENHPGEKQEVKEEDKKEE
jgi:large subunit ribosomal protein L3